MPAAARSAAPVRFWPTALLLALCALLYLPGLWSLPVVDRDEARFAQATRQMIESGDFINIRFQDEPRHKKPIGVHWAQAAAARLSAPLADENAIWPYRLPSALGAMLAVWLLYFFLRSIAGEGAALLAAALLASSVLLNVEARLATTDALLLACVVASQGSLMRRLMEPHARPLAWSLVFWISQALAVLIKGPIAPLVSIFTLLGMRLGGARVRPLRLLHAWVGLPLSLLIILPWVLAVSRATGGSFFVDAFAGDLFPKLVSGQESHGFPPGYYLLLVTLTFWPGSLLAGFALRSAWREKTEPLMRFMLAWLVPAWIVFELVPTKLPHYVLPLYPALATITAVQVVRWAAGPVEPQRPSRRALLIGWIVWSLVTLALAAVIIALPIALDGALEPWSLLSAGAALLCVAIGFAAVRRLDAAPAALGVLALCSALLLGPTMMVVLPRIEALWPTRSVARLIEARGLSGAQPWAAVGDHEPSLVFELGTSTRLLGPARAAEALNSGQVHGVIIDRDRRDLFDAAAREMGLETELIGTVRGTLISKGRWVELDLLIRAGDQ